MYVIIPFEFVIQQVHLLAGLSTTTYGISSNPSVWFTSSIKKCTDVLFSHQSPCYIDITLLSI